MDRTLASLSRNKEIELNNDCSKKFCGGRTAQSIVCGGLLVALALATSGIASAQEAAEHKRNDVTYNQVQSPATPDTITPPEGNSAFLGTQGVGTQGYVCLPSGAGASWTVNGARPEATLFTDAFGAAFQIITHFLSPNTNPNEFAPNPLPFGNATWQSSLDSSAVWAQAQHAIPAGSDASCPNTGSISCLLLQVIGSKKGPTGGRSLTQTSYIQRLKTKGGSAPASGCAFAGDVGKQALVPYSADYIFFRADQ